MVLQDDWLKHILHVFIGVLITSIDAAMLILEFNSTGNGLGQGEARGFGLDILLLLPDFGGDVLGDQAVRGLDGWEVRLNK